MEEFLINSFKGEQSLIIIVSRLFLTFTIACLGAYTMEYYNVLNKTIKTVNVKKVLISSFIPAFLVTTFFNGIVTKFNMSAVLLVTFIAGFLGYDMLRYVKEMGIKGVVAKIIAILDILSNKSLNNCDDKSDNNAAKEKKTKKTKKDK